MRERERSLWIARDRRDSQRSASSTASWSWTGTHGFLVFSLSCCLLATGCVRPAPDLHAPYAKTVREVDRIPLVVVHGILGARLRDRHSGRELWPGSFWRLLFHDYADLRLPIDPVLLEPIDDGLEPYAFSTLSRRQSYTKRYSVGGRLPACCKR